MTPDNFKKHVIFDRLNSLKKILSDEDIKKKIDIEKLSYFQTVSSFINQRIKLTVSELVQVAEMDSLSSEINEGVNQINNFVGNNNESHLSNAINNFSAAINIIRSFPIPISKNDFDFSRKIADFEDIVANKYKDLEKEKDELNNEINNLNTELLSNQNDIKKLIDLIVSSQ